MIKQFTAGDITVRPFGTFKHWTIQSINTASVDSYGFNTYYDGKLEINRGVSLSTNFYPSGSQYYDPIAEPLNPSGKYARNVYSQTNAMFYKYSNNPLTSFGVQEYTQDLTTGRKEIREIHDKITVATLKHNLYGDSVSPETVEIVDDSSPHVTYKLYDDGYTNLRLSGSYFPTTIQIGGVQDFVATPYWVTSSGQFVVTFDNGSTAVVGEANAKYYMDMGLSVEYIPPSSGSDWAYDQSTARNYFQPNNEHFGEAVSSWYRYIAVGSSMDSYSLSNRLVGYTSIYKYDDASAQHRFIKQLYFPFTQSLDSTASFTDSFGYSVAIRDDFLAVGSPVGAACSSSIYPGFVCVYNKNKGGTDFWGITNLLGGITNGDRFGNSVSVDDDILAVGAPGVSGSGAVYIFRKKRFMDTGACDSIATGSTWHQLITTSDFCRQLLTASYNATQSYTPTFVSGNFSWEYEAVVTSSVLASGDNFGWALEVSDNRMLVGTYKAGKGYASLFTCSYHSASAFACPTASWSEQLIVRGNSSYGDLDRSSPLYLNDVSSTYATTDLFGSSVSINGDNFVVASPVDKAFIPYNGASNVTKLGAAYFYRYGNNFNCDLIKTFGNQSYTSGNNFAKRVSLEGNFAAVSAWPSVLTRAVSYSGSAYILESSSYQSSSPDDSVLGRVFVYKDYTGDGDWFLNGDIRRNKESGNPYNIFGWSVSVCSDFLTVGGPIVNSVVPASRSLVIDPGHLTASMASTYSGSVFVYNLNQYTPDQPVGNVFYKNGNIVLTNTASNYTTILTGTGSRGFTLDYKGDHTIYEHEYLVSIRPGEFNYSTNPTALIQNQLVFDVNRDGVFDYLDVDLIMRYLQSKKFYKESVFDDNGIVLEQDTLIDSSWWGNDILQTESEDVLLQEVDSNYMVSSSLNVFTKAAFDYIEQNLVVTNILDVDGDGQINVNDGSLLALYYFQRLNPTVISPLITTASTRKYVSDIVAYLNQFCGRADFKVNPEFFGYQSSSSYDPTGSFLAPFVTTIGLYQNNELVAVGKLGKPIKNLVDWPVNFIVRFDT